jgi:L-ascorbate metabolism protein UlaG (beta-lactamase superfamily)
MTKLKGEVELEFTGHFGFKLQWMDDLNNQRVIYIDHWNGAKECPTYLKKQTPNDCDLALVTHGAEDHSSGAPILIYHGKKEARKIVATSELNYYYVVLMKIPTEGTASMQPGGNVDLGWVKITMVHAEFPSIVFNRLQKHMPGTMPLLPGGLACGFVIEIPKYDLRIYHAGNTNAFSDMKIIDDLYKPNIAMLPISDVQGMGPNEAAYCAKHYLPGVKKFIPMGFPQHVEEKPKIFEMAYKKLGGEAKIVRPNEFNPDDKMYSGKPLIESLGIEEL